MRQTLRWVALVAAALATIGCDRATKHVATALLAGEPDRSYLADTVRLGYAENTGGFLSLGADWPKAARIAVFTVATGFALLALVMVAIRIGSRDRPPWDLSCSWPAVHRTGLTVFFTAASWTSSTSA